MDPLPGRKRGLIHLQSFQFIWQFKSLIHKYLKTELPNNQKTPKGERGRSLTRFLSNERVGDKSVRIHHKAIITVLKTTYPLTGGIVQWFSPGMQRATTAIIKSQPDKIRCID